MLDTISLLFSPVLNGFGQIIIANMTDPDDLRRHHFADYLETVRPRTASGKFEEATR